SRLCDGPPMGLAVGKRRSRAGRHEQDRERRLLSGAAQHAAGRYGQTGRHPRTTTMTRDIERRTIDAVELRFAADEPTKLVGHAALFNSVSPDLGGFREQ